LIRLPLLLVNMRQSSFAYSGYAGGAEIDETVNGYLNSIIDSKTRKKIAHQVWAELVK
jgi:hypothetical protein